MSKERIKQKKPDQSEGLVRHQFEQIVKEMERAQKKHPNWPEDFIHQAAIMVEEAGETLRAAIQYEREGGKIEEIDKEAIESAAMCLRILCGA